MSYCTPCRRPLTDSTQKTQGLQKPFPILWEDWNKVQECLHMVKWVVQRVASGPSRAPVYYTSPL